MTKKYALYAFSTQQEIADYHYMQLFFYVHEEMNLTMEDVEIFIDCSQTQRPALDYLMNRLNEFQAIITPGYHHFNPCFDCYKSNFEELFIRNGLYVVCLNEEEFNLEITI